MRQLSFVGSFKYIFMLVCVVVAVFPLVWVFFSSFKTNAEIFASGIALPTTYNLDGFRAALDIAPIPRFFVNSVIIGVATTVLNVSLVSMAAYVFARFTFKGKNLLYALIMLSLVIPMTALLHPVYIVIQRMGLADTYMGMVLVYTALNLPMSLLILRASFASIPRGLEEAAYIDGASFMRTFVQVMLPCAKGGLASAAVLTFLGSWNEFTFALILTSSERVRTLPLALSFFQSQFTFNFTAMFAAITIAVVPSIVVFAIFQEQVVSSLTAGSMKE